MAFDQSGDVTFPVDGSPRVFRFRVSVCSDELLRVWIEDTSNSEQWQTDALAIADFVTAATTLPQAEASDYAMRIIESINPSTDTDSPTSSLSRPADDGSRILCVGFELRIMTRSIPIEYAFTLHAVVLDPIDRLKIRVETLEKSEQAMAADAQNKQNKIDRLEEVNRELMTTVAATKTDLATLSKGSAHTVNTLKSEVAVLAASLKNSNAKLSQIDALVVQNRELKATSEALKSQVSRLSSSLAAMTEELKPLKLLLGKVPSSQAPEATETRKSQPTQAKRTQHTNSDVFLDFGEEIGRLDFELRLSAVPTAAGHFRKLCLRQAELNGKSLRLSKSWLTNRNDLAVFDVMVDGWTPQQWGQIVRTHNFKVEDFQGTAMRGDLIMMGDIADPRKPCPLFRLCWASVTSDKYKNIVVIGRVVDDEATLDKIMACTSRGEQAHVHVCGASN